ncbi:MAG: phosphatidylserine decarboxylase family protein [Bacteroidales bacterium]|nr:phosphatidylserine decarboxylase family protein [Bacteroidales bacterium]MDD3201814.1 phosphatidylserine decarboxylase family protein [Bacteroidales bacterium]
MRRIINKEGYGIIAVNSVIWIAVAVVSLLYIDSLAVKSLLIGLSVIMFCFMFTFFRIPKRVPVIDGMAVVSPGDGRVVNIQDCEENEYFHGKCLQMSVYLNFFNVHITWFPVGGNVTYYKYHPGRYIFAWHPKSSEKNEHTTIAMKSDSGHDIMFRQIAGIVARRIVCYAKEGEHFAQTEDAGIIKFGSRLDIFLPLGSEILAKVGDHVKGRETVVARFQNPQK